MANLCELQSLFSINFGLSVPNTVLKRLINYYLYIHSIRMGTYNDIFKHNMAHRSMHATFFVFFNICDKPNDKIEQI